MTVYFRTAGRMADAPDGYPAATGDPLSFTARGWDEFSSEVARARPEAADLIHRLRLPVDDQPRHPTYLVHGQPMALAWTAGECLALHRSLLRAGGGAPGAARDMREFTALVAAGVADGGLCTF